MESKSPEQERFRYNLFQFQAAKGMSEVELSRSIGRCDSYIQSLSSGKNTPRFSSFIELSRVLEREPIEFFLEAQQSDYLIKTIHLMEAMPETDKEAMLRFAEQLTKARTSASDADTEKENNSDR